MSTAAFILSIIACLLCAAGLWLFASIQRKEQTRVIQEQLQRSLQIQAASAPLPFGSSLSQANAQPPIDHPPIARYLHALWQWLVEHLHADTWAVSAQTLAIICGAGLIFALFAASQGGALLGLMALLAYAAVASFVIWQRKSKRREKLLQQLPSFLDNMVRLISIGNSPQSAFQLSVGSAPAPLSEALQQATASLSASPDLGHAMSTLERNWQMREFGLLAAVFRMSTRYGGRADLVLERVAAYIRDQQSAQRELHAMSAEVRLSAWILALLPIAVGAIILILNQGYFMRLWNDESGQKILFIAAALEVLGSLLLYRLARLR